MQKIIESKIESLKKLCEKYDVKAMYLFGSACTDKFSSNSDIDILFSFKDIPFEQYAEYYFNLHEELEVLFDRKIDLVTERSLSNPYFIESVNQTKRLLYAA